MKSLMLLSTEPYSGKTGLSVNLVLEFRSRGHTAGYFKPVGNLPTRIDSTFTDADAVFAKKALDLTEPLDRLCPHILTSGESRRRLKDGAEDIVPKIKIAYDSVLNGKDLLILEGSGHMNDGRLYGAMAVDLVGLLDARAVLVVKLDNPYEIVDDVLVASDRLGGALAGVIFNWVNANQREVIEELVAPFLARQGIASFGMIPRDESLLAISVDSLTKALGGRVLCAENHGSDSVETFMVGAMGQEQALRFFRRKSHKAVITGGDRADVQLAALETNTACLVLTGNYMPPATILAVAESKGVPVVLVDMDTLTAVERTESLIGHLRVHDEEKLKAMRQRMDEYLDIDKLCEAAG
ncbi:MAG: phosphotransacetylase family protein [Actinomycetota bacterium]|nr:phosphotransacetylase family protein [Actinomycetota bacterium]